MKPKKRKSYKKRNAKINHRKKKSVNDKNTSVIWLRNKKYKFIRTRALPRDCWGVCDDPSGAFRKIKVDRKLRGMKELEVILHEMLHACFWDIDEKVIKEVGADMSKALWVMGYKK